MNFSSLELLWSGPLATATASGLRQESSCQVDKCGEINACTRHGTFSRCQINVTKGVETKHKTNPFNSAWPLCVLRPCRSRSA